MYIIIPATFIVLSIVGIGFVIWRKFEFLKKLTPDEAHKDIHLLELYFPEVKAKYRGIDVSEYKKLWLSETEKMLRKLRMISLKVDRISDSMIKRVRHAHTKEQAKSIEAQEKIAGESAPKIEELYDATEMLKREEQRLIVEISKNPKDAMLYLSLGDLYMRLDHYEDAKNSYETCIKLDADNEAYAEKLKKAHEKIGTNADLAQR